jgi:hypothetical protein
LNSPPIPNPTLSSNRSKFYLRELNKLFNHKKSGICNEKDVALPGKQAANRENKHQPIVSGETSLLNSRSLYSSSIV